ncbi:MAG: hypothetical protein JXA33_06275 [Anaerolineae bacterium]|nr:hypothetical protein [Anaerolineae bacterium]
MEFTHDYITELEWANYAAMKATAQATPDLDLILRPDVILNRIPVFPTPDLNHACLLRATPTTIDALLDEIIAYYQAQDLPTTIFLSPACTPADLPERLYQRGFIRNDETEAWLLLSHARDFALGKPASDVRVEQIDKSAALTFAEIFLQSFDMPLDYAPYMAQLLTPSIGLPNVYHYIAYMEEQAVGVCSLLCYQNELAIVGSAGILPVRRGHRVLASLSYQVLHQGQRHGIDKALLQTTAGAMFERFLRISGFKRVFTRSCYVLS